MNEDTLYDDLAPFFRDLTVATPQELADALNRIAPYAGFWGVLEPISAGALRHFLPAWIRDSAYTNFSVPKKGGGVRVIRAPHHPLKEIQAALNVLLQGLFTPSAHAYGFVRGRNILGNAALHAGQTCVYNLDLSDFFPSISREMLTAAMRRELSGRLSDEVIRLICALATVARPDGTEALPQGAPTSPVLSNVTLKRLDGRLADIAERAGYRYSRYADDITFSHSHPVRKIEPRWRDRIDRAIADEGLSVNEAKRRTLVPGKRMEVTGLTVNARPNVARSYAKQLRTLLHLWEKYGYPQAQAIFSRDFQPGTGKELHNVVKGKINYLEMVKGTDDPAFRKLRLRYRKLKRGPAKLKSKTKDQSNETHLP